MSFSTARVSAQIDGHVTALEIWLLKRMEGVYYYYPWKWLLKSGTKGVSVTDYGRNLMHKIMMTYDGDKKRYSKISGHGMKMLAEAMEKNLPYEINCPALLICGEKDMAGSCIRYNKAWHKNSNIPIETLYHAENYAFLYHFHKYSGNIVVEHQ